MATEKKYLEFVVNAALYELEVKCLLTSASYLDISYNTRINVTDPITILNASPNDVIPLVSKYLSTHHSWTQYKQSMYSYLGTKILCACNIKPPSEELTGTLKTVQEGMDIYAVTGRLREFYETDTEMTIYSNVKELVRQNITYRYFELKPDVRDILSEVILKHDMEAVKRELNSLHYRFIDQHVEMYLRFILWCLSQIVYNILLFRCKNPINYNMMPYNYPIYSSAGPIIKTSDFVMD